MAVNFETEVGIVIQGKNASKETFNEAAKSAENLTQKHQALDGQIKAIPASFSKAGRALNALEFETTKYGGALASVTEKVSKVAYMAMSGGPFGVAMAGATLAVAGLTATYEYLNRNVVDNEIIIKSAVEVYKLMNEKIDSAKDSLKNLNSELNDFGKTQKDVAIEDVKKSIAEKENSLRIENDHIIALEEAAKFAAVSNSLEVQQAVAQQESGRKRISLIKEELVAEQALLEKIIEAAGLEKIGNDTLEESKKINEEIAKELKKQVDAAQKLNVIERMNADAWNRQQIANITRTQEQRKKSEAEGVKGLQSEFRMWSNYYTMRADRTEALARKEQQADEQRQMANIEYGQMVGNTLGQMIADQDNAGKIMAQSVLGMAQKAVMAYAAEAAAGAASSQAGIPIIGPILAAAAASAMFGIVSAYVGKMAEGGVVSGTPGRDRQLFYGTTGERVLTVKQTEAFDKLVKNMTERGGSAGTVNNMGGTTVNFAPRMDFLAIPESAGRKKVLLALAKDFEELVNSGLMLRNVVRR